MKQILLAFQFYTLIPIKVKGEVLEKEIAQAAGFFPLVGAFQGLVLALLSFILIRFFPHDLTSGLLILISLLISGGFDLDGLADTVDALAVKSTGNDLIDRQKRLMVMKDSNIGAMGTLALIMAILLKYLLFKSLLSHQLTSAYAVLFLMPVFSKWVPIPVMYHGQSAREDGLGKIFIDHVDLTTLALSSFWVLLCSFLVIAFRVWNLSIIKGTGFCLVLFLFFYLLDLLSINFFKESFGGLTGDHFGALTEVSEIIFLLASYL